MSRASRSVLVIGSVILAMLLLGGRQIVNAEPTQGGDAKGEQLHETMEQMGKLFKQIRGSLKDTTKYAAAADAAAKMEGLVLEAKTLMPEKVEKMPADQRARAMKQYRMDLCILLGHLSELESALVEGDQTKATAALAACGATMKKGHEAFREKVD
ncbi:MAG: cytochrome b562 [Phycisphaerales bacterium]